MMAEAEKIVVAKKHGAISGKEMFRVKGDPNGWCVSVEAAVSQYRKCKVWWENYHKTGGKR
jgi:hypothetical protein